MKNREWAERAACKDEDPDIFYPDNGEYKHAKAICDRCPVREECLQDEPDGVPHGMRGGLTPDERIRLRRNRTRSMHQVSAEDIRTGVKRCWRGHEQTPETMVVTSDGRKKECLLCKRARQAAKREERARLRDAGVVKVGGARDQSWRVSA